jgi:hypothetical protein
MLDKPPLTNSPQIWCSENIVHRRLPQFGFALLLSLFLISFWGIVVVKNEARAVTTQPSRATKFFFTFFLNRHNFFHWRRLNRRVLVKIYNRQHQLIKTKEGQVTLNPNNGSLTGSVDIGTDLPSGDYIIKPEIPEFVPPANDNPQPITAGSDNQIPPVTIVTGDINSDGQINVLDYNVLAGCYSDLLPAKDCNPTNAGLADLTDDGAVNQLDYNLFLREWKSLNK